MDNAQIRPVSPQWSGAAWARCAIVLAAGVWSLNRQPGRGRAGPDRPVVHVPAADHPYPARHCIGGAPRPGYGDHRSLVAALASDGHGNGRRRCPAGGQLPRSRVGWDTILASGQSDAVASFRILPAAAPEPSPDPSRCTATSSPKPRPRAPGPDLPRVPAPVALLRRRPVLPPRPQAVIPRSLSATARGDGRCRRPRRCSLVAAARHVRRAASEVASPS
jgi:hypothetical protein